MGDGDWTLTITGERTARHRCPICGKLYAYNPERQVSCCVAHGPGQCYHYGETLVPEEPVENWYPLPIGHPPLTGIADDDCTQYAIDSATGEVTITPLPGGDLTANDTG